MEIVDDTLLPGLRDELQFLQAAHDGDGTSGCLIYDPVRHTYFRIGVDAAIAFASWSAGTAGRLVENLKGQGIAFGMKDVELLLKFAMDNALCNAMPGQSQNLIRKNISSRKSAFKHVLHSYLFFKIPLVRPQQFLDAAFPYIRWLGSRATIRAIFLITLAGIYLTARQFDVFIHSFADFANWDGAVLLFVSLLVLKTSHELGHAFVATNFRCRVPVMGVAFLVMFPMLYSDVSDAWRLRERRKRLMVDGAGMMVEMAIGGICLFFWALLPPGILRNLCLFMATTGWVMSLAVNLSPFMRFDGYHILADALGMHNLQARGFALGRWQMRRILFGLQDPLPERFSPRRHRLLVAYSWATWLYRFLLFLGIALLVYFMFFKLLGIFLFAVEIAWFIGLPLYREISFWWQRRGELLRRRRAWLTFLLGGGLLVLLFLPLGTSISVPAVIGARNDAGYYTPIGARVDQVLVSPGARVAKGDVLLTLTSVELQDARLRAKLKLALVNTRVARGTANLQEKALRSVLQRQAGALRGEIAGLDRQMEALVLRADFDGVVSDMAVGLRSGMWVNQEQRLVHLSGTSGYQKVRGLVSGSRVNRLEAGNRGIFVPENPTGERVEVVLDSIGMGNGAGRELAYLSAQNHGVIKMDVDSTGKARPVDALYPLVFSTPERHTGIWRHEGRGTVIVKASAQSVMGRFFRHAISVLLRETGF